MRAGVGVVVFEARLVAVRVGMRPVGTRVLVVVLDVLVVVSGVRMGVAAIAASESR